MYWNLIWKSPGFVQFGFQSDPLWSQTYHPCPRSEDLCLPAVLYDSTQRTVWDPDCRASLSPGPVIPPFMSQAIKTKVNADWPALGADCRVIYVLDSPELHGPHSGPEWSWNRKTTCTLQNLKPVSAPISQRWRNMGLLKICSESQNELIYN